MTMVVVIIAGGSGTRLWPLSTPGYPKHLLSVENSEVSLLQETYRRARRLAEHVYVVSEEGHIQHVREQLPDLPEDAFIVEPARRGTANCIIAALAAIADRHDPQEPIAFTHSDHYIRDTDGFVNSIQVASDTSQANQSIVLVGVEPDYPATGFGYIQKDALLGQDQMVYRVKSFQEKPDFQTAKKYLASGNYLWNCGYFVGSTATFEAKMRAFAPDLLGSYERLRAATPDQYQQVYLELETEAIDYALIEKVDDLLVVPASFDWMDLGSFNDLHKAIGGDECGNVVSGPVRIEQVENSYVENQDEKPVVVIGLDNVVVVNTPNGILVARKDLSQKVGDISKQLEQ